MKDGSSNSILSLEQLLTANNYEKIALNTFTTGHLYLMATFNGVLARFILDTGAGATVLEIGKKQKFNFSTEVTTEFGTGAGATDLELLLSKCNTIQFDELLIEDFEVAVMDLSHVNHALREKGNEEVDGVIGADILSNHKGVIDYADLSLYLLL